MWSRSALVVQRTPGGRLGVVRWTSHSHPRHRNPPTVTRAPINGERFGALAARGHHAAEGSSDRRPTLTHKTAVPDLRPFGYPPQARSPGRPPQNTSKCVNREVRPSKPALLLRFNPGTTHTHLRRRFCVGGGGGDFVRHVRQTSHERLGGLWGGGAQMQAKGCSDVA